MKKWTKGGVVLSIKTIILSGCTGKSNFTDKAQAAAPATTENSHGNIQYAFTQAGNIPRNF